jgi:hypothetical protein
MPPRRKRAWLGLLGRYLALVVVLGAIATAAYAVVEIENRPTVLRLVVAAFVVVVLVHLHGHLRDQLEFTQLSSFDQARASPPSDANIAPVVGRLTEQVRQSVASQRYFEKVLWPKLEQLSRELGSQEPPPRLRGRRWRGRGPSLEAIADLMRGLGDTRCK